MAGKQYTPDYTSVDELEPDYRLDVNIYWAETGTIINAGYKGDISIGDDVCVTSEGFVKKNKGSMTTIGRVLSLSEDGSLCRVIVY